MPIKFLQKVFALPKAAWQHWVGVLGILFTTIFALMLVGMFLFELAGFSPGPYGGIVSVFILPAGFVFSLLLIPLGGWLARRSETKLGVAHAQRFPVIDLNQGGMRKTAVTIAALSVVNFFLVSIATYRGIEYMDSVQFCGKTCHRVMEPEYTVYSRSPHSRVRCIECHIGPGAPWFVRSKISGSYQVISVLFHLYPMPIPTPVENLRPARETCEQCHWPEKFSGKRMKVVRRYGEDEANTRLTTVLMMNIGGINPASGKYEGIHWHVSPDVRITYYPKDESRKEIPYVQVEEQGGRKEIFKGSKDFVPPKDTPPRVMDCIDCHNRPTHIYEDPAFAVDAALETGKIPRELPFAKKAFLEAVKGEYKSRDEAASGIEKSIRGFYENNYKDKEGVTPERVSAAAAEAVRIYSRNVFPSMHIDWNTYPDNLGHTRSIGCYRCHDEEHKSEKGNTISQDCTICHTPVAMEEKNPAVLEQLGTQ